MPPKTRKRDRTPEGQRIIAEPKPKRRSMIRICARCGFFFIAVAFALTAAFILCVKTLLVDVEDPLMVDRDPALKDKFRGQNIHNDKESTPRRAFSTSNPSSRHHQEDGLFTNEDQGQAGTGRGSYAFGRYAHPINDMRVHSDINAFQRLAQLKEFVWFSVTGGDWYLGAAMLQFNYNAGVVVNLFNRKTKESFSRQIELPLMLGMAFGPYYTPDNVSQQSGLLRGCMRYDGFFGLATPAISFCSARLESGRAAIDVTLDGQLQSSSSTSTINIKTSFRIDLSLQEFPTMVFPLGPRRASIVSKIAAAPATDVEFGDSVRLEIDGKLHSMKGSVASVDYTRGLLRRFTRWYWLSLSTADPTSFRPSAVDGAPVKSYGMHLSSGTYDFVDGASAESSIFTNGESFRFYDAPGGVKFTPLDSAVKPSETTWHITGRNLNLTFTPHGKFLGAFHYGILDGDLWHLWGVFNGIAPLSSQVREDGLGTVVLTNVAGVMEDHYALW